MPTLQKICSNSKVIGLFVTILALGAVFFALEAGALDGILVHQHVSHAAPTDQYGCHRDASGYYHCH